MPDRPKVAQLPDEIRAWLDAELIKRGFGGYVPLAELLAEQGYEISKSAVHRYGQKLQRKLEAIRASTQAAAAIAEAAPDDADLRSAATIGLVQTEIFDVLVTLQEAEDADPQDRLNLLSKAARAIADIARASLSQKKRQDEVRLQERERIAGVIEETARAQGMDEAQARFWRERVLGVT